jgi:hypothetical protein
MNFTLLIAGHPRPSLMLQVFTGVSKAERRKEISVQHLHRELGERNEQTNHQLKIKK